MKMTMCTVPTTVSRAQPRERRPGRPPGGGGGKKLIMTRNYPGKIRSMARRSLDPCDNSNDSGLGFDHHTDHPHAVVDRLNNWQDERATPTATTTPTTTAPQHHHHHHHHKRPRLDIKLENDEVNDSYCFPETVHCKENANLIRTAPAGAIANLRANGNQPNATRHAAPRCAPLSSKNAATAAPLNLITQLSAATHAGDVSLAILSQPEQQHRARYQTEGSRGAVKDRSGNGFPVIRLIGYNKPATLQVFIGTDLGKVAPHMFYQACKVSGKNSTPCSERKLDGTIVIEMQLDPAKEMTATCDCVGILKERNVDVEHRFPEQLGARNKKKSTRCRMVFRTTIAHDDGKTETLQICSQPIVCTQPPGIPEICKKSLTTCPANGGLELFILGKNFLKDTTVYFQQTNDDHHRRARWEESVVPDKEFLQQTHLVCVVPPYRNPNITEPVTVRLYVVSSGKNSEAHQFVYTPVNDGTAVATVRHEEVAVPAADAAIVRSPTPPPFKLSRWQSPIETNNNNDNETTAVADSGMMPPPDTHLVPLATQRRPSLVQEAHSPPTRVFKQEPVVDENSQSSIVDVGEQQQQLHVERYRHLSEGSDTNASMMTESSQHSIGDASNDTSGSNPNLPAIVVQGLIGHGAPLPLNLATALSEGADANRTNALLQPVAATTTATPTTTAATTASTIVNNPTTAGCSSSTTDADIVVPELNVMDLRMKTSMGTIADLANTKEPSMATLQSFGVTEHTTNPLPAQSGQSVESYLTDLENKDVLEYVAKLPHAATSNAARISAQKLDDLVNSAVDSHIAHAPTHERKELMLDGATQRQEMMLTSIMNATSPIMAGSATMMTANASLLGGTSPMLNSTLLSATSPSLLMGGNGALPAPNLVQTVAIAVQQQQQGSPNLSPEVILNSQISPSLMCRANASQLSQDSLLATNLSPNMSPNLSPNRLQGQLIDAPMTLPEPEKVILLNAAVDLYETQNKIKELTKTNGVIGSLLATTSPPSVKRNGADLLESSDLAVADETILTAATEAIMTPAESLLVTTGGGLLATTANILATSPNLLTVNASLLPASNGNGNATNLLSPSANSTIVGNGSLLSTSNSNLLAAPQTQLCNFVEASNIELMAVQQQQKALPVAEENVAATLKPTDKKNEDRMIPRVFETMSENELISMINPSCFDQGNNFHH